MGQDRPINALLPGFAQVHVFNSTRIKPFIPVYMPIAMYLGVFAQNTPRSRVSACFHLPRPPRQPCMCSASVESRGGAVTVGRVRLLPPLSSGGVSIARPWFRFHLPLIEPGGPLSGTGLSDKASSHRTREIMKHGIAVARVPAFDTGTRRGSVRFPYWQFCACCITTGAAAARCSSQSHDRLC